MHVGDVRSVERRECFDRRTTSAQERIKQIEIGGWKKINKGFRYRELEVCEDEQSEMALLGHVTYQFDEEGNKVEIDFGKRSRELGEERVWDSML